MGRPRLIILIRHAQSEGNKNREIHQTIPDHRVRLTPDGLEQAREAGRRLRSMLRADDTLHFFTSPYRRTRETTEGILSTLTTDDPDPSPFKRSNIKVYEEPRLREQDFGNFQPCSAEMERMWQERADYGHFFYRIPNGESAADAYDRVSGFNESLWRYFGEDDFASVCVLVTHGLMSRVFLMKWYHFSVEYFEDLRNVNHCEFLIMKKQPDSGNYILQNKLRTWSELRRERAALKAKEEVDRAKEGDLSISTPTIKPPSRQNSLTSSPIVQQRRWGGCPEGCNHAQHFKVRRDLAELRSVDEKNAAKHVITAKSDPKPAADKTLNGTGTSSSSGSSGMTIASRRANPAASRPHLRPANSSDDDSDDPRGHIVTIVTGSSTSSSSPPKIDVTRAREEVVSSPDGTPSFITVEDRLRNHIKSAASSPSPAAAYHQRFLHVGRDFGGTQSGANSDAEISEDDARQRLASRAAKAKGASNGSAGSGLKGAIGSSTKLAGGGGGGGGGSGSVGGDKDAGAGGKYLLSRGAHANRLGDAPASGSDQGSDGGDEHEEDGDADVDADAGDEGDEDDLEGVEDLDEAEREDRSLRGSVY